MGAAGRDFHNFNMVFRNRREWEVVAFSATQIPHIEDRWYPPELAGTLYPKGIPIIPESEVPEWIEKHNVDVVVFAYSDVSHTYVMHRASIAISRGADFWLLGPKQTALSSKLPVVAIGAVRTGSGKSPTTLQVARALKQLGKHPVIIRHPMPYGDLRTQIVQRFATVEDLDKTPLTLEEREEYERQVEAGFVVFAGVDYEKILQEVEKEADIIVWDGGNNDLPFLRPDLFIVLVDPLRAGEEMNSYPGEACVRSADILIINKTDTATKAQVEQVRANCIALNPQARILLATSPIVVRHPEWISGKKVLVVEDGPTLTHGGMPFGAGYLAAQKYEAQEIVDPKPYLTPAFQSIFRKYPHLDKILPAMGYSPDELRELQDIIEKAPCETVVVATPVNFSSLVSSTKPFVHVRYEIQLVGTDFRQLLSEFLEKHNKL
ncbi:MAG: cyclic 2,3-diphosphoglycerate synthase [bacterium]